MFEFQYTWFFSFRYGPYRTTGSSTSSSSSSPSLSPSSSSCRNFSIPQQVLLSWFRHSSLSLRSERLVGVYVFLQFSLSLSPVLLTSIIHLVPVLPLVFAIASHILLIMSILITFSTSLALFSLICSEMFLMF